jgi:hypothetical protein
VSAAEEGVNLPQAAGPGDAALTPVARLIGRFGDGGLDAAPVQVSADGGAGILSAARQVITVR